MSRVLRRADGLNLSNSYVSVAFLFLVSRIPPINLPSRESPSVDCRAYLVDSHTYRQTSSSPFPDDADGVHVASSDLVNWTCNCSLYNTLVLVVYIILLSERGSERWLRGVRRDYLAFLTHVGRGAFGNANVGGGAFGNANAGWNTQKQIIFWSNLNCKFKIFFAGKRTVGTVLD